MKPAREHCHDEDCVIGEDGCCIECGSADGPPCPECGGRLFHRDGCPEIEP